MRRQALFALVVFGVTFVIACGGQEPAASPQQGPTNASAPPPPPPASAAASSEPEPAVHRKPFEIYSHCGDVVTVVFGEDAKAANGGGHTIAPSASIEGPRDADGNQTVWLLDNAGAPLIKVRVTRGMKRVEIGRSCRTLDAR